MQVLLTYFEPFGEDAVNSSEEAARLVPDTVEDTRVIRLRLPVVFQEAGNALTEAIRTYRPDFVIATGQAGGIPGLHLERVAVNLRDASRPDNGGNQPADQPIVPGGAAAYFATLPVRQIKGALDAAGIPAALSYSAGTYVCNDVMYTLLSQQERLGGLGGFIHVPYTPQQAAEKGGNVPSLSPADAARGLTEAIRVTAQTLRAGDCRTGKEFS